VSKEISYYLVVHQQCLYSLLSVLRAHDYPLISIIIFKYHNLQFCNMCIDRNDITVVDCYKNNGIIIIMWSIKRIIMSIMIHYFGKFGIA